MCTYLYFFHSEFEEEAVAEGKSADAGIGDWFKLPGLPGLPGLPELPKLPSLPSLFGTGKKSTPQGPQAKLDGAQTLSFGDKQVVSYNFLSFDLLSLDSLTLLPILRFVLDKKFQRNASKFAMF